MLMMGRGVKNRTRANNRLCLAFPKALPPFREATRWHQYPFFCARAVYTSPVVPGHILLAIVMGLDLGF